MGKAIKRLALPAAALGFLVVALVLRKGVECYGYAAGSLRLDRPEQNEAPTDGCYGISVNHEYKTYIMPRPKTAEVFSLGLGKMIADLLFVEVIAETTWEETAPGFYDWIYSRALLITELHPRYEYVYHSVGNYLSLKNQIEESNDIFRRGMEVFPDNYVMPFMIAWNHYFVLEDKWAAAPWFREACERPNAPPHMCAMAAKLLTEKKTDPYALAGMFLNAYCINADEKRAEKIYADFEERVLPLFESDEKREKLLAEVRARMEYCRQQFEEQHG